MTNSPQRPIRAGEAFLQNLERNDPEGLRKSQARLRILGEELQPILGHFHEKVFGPILENMARAQTSMSRTLQQILAEAKQQLDAQLKQLAEETGVESEAIAVKWQEVYGEPYPQTIDDWKRLAARSEVSGERLLMGEWTYGDLLPIIEGYLQGQAERKSGGDTAPFVSASTLWREKFKTNRELTKFRQKHPEMFRNPSPYKLEIHAARWACYWAKRDKAGFEALGENAVSIADDHDVQDVALAEAAQRAAEIRAQKKAKKR